MPAGQGLKYKGSCKHPTAWCIYSHESRIALLATGEGGLWLQVTHITTLHIQGKGFRVAQDQSGWTKMIPHQTLHNCLASYW